MKNRILYGILFLIFFVVGSTFQNCANHSFVENSVNLSSLSQDHPDPQPVLEKSTSELLLIDRVGVHSLLSEVFLTNVLNATDIAAFHGLFNAEVLLQQHMYGHPCDIIASGSTLDCGYNYANLTIGMSQSSSTIREASRVQMCRRLVAQDGLMNTLVARIKGEDVTPTSESLQRAIQLFYPSWEDNGEIIIELQSLDYKMAMNSESTKDRWRMIILTICESPYWEIL